MTLAIVFIMTSKKHLSKYALCVILYIFLCLLLLFIKIHRSFDDKSRDPGNSSSPVTIDPIDPIELHETPIDTQLIESALQRVATVCEKYNKTTSLERRHFYHAPSHNALFCWIRKVASTSFTKLFAELRGINIQRNYYK